MSPAASTGWSAWSRCCGRKSAVAPPDHRSLGLTLLGVGPAGAQDLCSQLTIPSQLGLACAAGRRPRHGRGDAGRRHIRAAQPDEPAPARPSRGRRPSLERPRGLAARADDARYDRGCRSRSAAWSRTRTAPSPATRPRLPWRASSAPWPASRALALGACDEPAPDGPDRWQMRCNYAADGLGLQVVLRLVAAGDRRWAITMRAANEQRLRHFEAIANSFQPS